MSVNIYGQPIYIYRHYKNTPNAIQILVRSVEIILNELLQLFSTQSGSYDFGIPVHYDCVWDGCHVIFLGSIAFPSSEVGEMSPRQVVVRDGFFPCVVV